MKKILILSGLLLLGLFGSSCVVAMAEQRDGVAQQEVVRTLDQINSLYLQQFYQLLAQFEDTAREARGRNNALDQVALDEAVIAFENQIAAWSRDYERWLPELENDPRNNRTVQQLRSYYLVQLRGEVIRDLENVRNVREDARIGIRERIVAGVVAEVNGLGQLEDRIGELLARELRLDFNKILLLGSAVLVLSVHRIISNLMFSEAAENITSNKFI